MKTILIVDDEPVLRSLLVLYITSAGYRALEAATGAEAIQVAENFPDQIDLAIIDHTLEDRKGAEVGTELAALQPRIRMLLISGALEEEVTSELASDGPIPSFLQKPFSKAALLDKIRQMLADRSAGSAGTH